MYLSFQKPHVPYTAPTGQDGEILYNKYIGHLSLDQHGTVPVDMPADMPGLNDYDKDYPYPGADSKRAEYLNMSDETIRLARARYYASINWIDHMIGNVLDKLDELDDPRNPGKKLSQTTIVIYTTDHGDMMGEKYLFLKNQHYEGSARVPFIVRMPGVIPEGSRSEILMNHVDMIPTLAGLAGCGAGIDANTYGKNYANAVLANDPALGPQRTFSVEGISAADAHPGNVMSRTLQYKFIRDRDKGPDDLHYPVLFDMINNPMETKNLAYDLAYAHIVNQENKAIDEFLSQFGVKPLNIVVSEKQ
jgi:choline-sulfatase